MYKLLANNKQVSGSWDNSIKIWNVDYGECIRTLTGHSKCVRSLQLLANNQLASGSFDKTIKIWNVETGVLKNDKSVNSSVVTVVSFKWRSS